MSEWLAGLGAGLQTLGSSGMQYLMQEQERRDRQERERLAKEQREAEIKRAARQQDLQFEQFRFQNDLTPYDEAVAPTRQVESVSDVMRTGGAALPAIGAGTMGMAGSAIASAGDALSELAQKSRARLAKGRTMDYTDASGKTVKYYQPYERTEEGKRETEMRRGIQSLKSAGFSDAEASAIMTSPEKLQSALIERLRPTAKGQPQRIVGPDGRVTFVQPPIMKPGETYDTGLTQNITVPGQAPYNWSLDTDDTTGQRVLVDPRTGQSRPVTTPGGQPLMNVPDKVREKAAAFGTLRANLELLKQLVQKSGIEVMPGETKSAMESALSQAQVAWKTYAELGALSGPDMGLVIQAIGDPTSVTAGLRGGEKGILSKLDTALGALDKEEQLFTEVYKFPIPGRKPPQGSQLTPQEQAIYDAAKLEGKSDGEIMAFLQRMRGGSL